MCSLQNRTEPNSEGFFNVDYFNIEESIGWNDTTELDQYIKNKNLDKQLTKKLIYEANKLFPLSSIIFKYNIDWSITENQSGWTHKSCCPFLDHKDGSPSFGYNSKDERFHCFGCQRSGNTVQFLSFMEKRSLLEIAKELLCSIKSPEDILIELDNAKSEQTDQLLQSFAQDIRLFLSKNSNNAKALKYIESLTWNLDVYLEKHSMNGTINFESLQARIEKLREYLVVFSE